MPKCTIVFKKESYAVVFSAAPGGTAVNRENVEGQADCPLHPVCPHLWCSETGTVSGTQDASRPLDNEFSICFPTSTEPRTVQTQLPSGSLP